VAAPSFSEAVVAGRFSRLPAVGERALKGATVTLWHRGQWTLDAPMLNIWTQNICTRFAFDTNLKRLAGKMDWPSHRAATKAELGSSLVPGCSSALHSFAADIPAELGFIDFIRYPAASHYHSSSYRILHYQAKFRSAERTLVGVWLLVIAFKLGIL
jgi:hypothetical protein